MEREWQLKVSRPTVDQRAYWERRDAKAEGIRKFYPGLSDSGLISVWAMGKNRADGVVMAEAETELVRRGDRSYEPAVWYRVARESIARKRGSN